MNLNQQKKLMRQMKQEIQGLCPEQGAGKKCEAFQVDEEDFSQHVEKIPITENDNLVKVGRLKIKNRIKSFTVVFSKSKGLQAAFKIQVCMDDPNFKNYYEF